MSRDPEAGEASRLPPVEQLQSRVRRGPDPFLVVCRFFSFITALTAVLCVFANVLSAIHSFRNGSDIFGGIFRCYAVALAIFVAVVETEWSFILKFWKVLEYWAGRGMLQILYVGYQFAIVAWLHLILLAPLVVAVMTRAFPDISGQRRELIALQEISSYLLLACGVIYVISGVLCIGFLKRARQRKETSKDQAARDLEELERRKRELEALLLAEIE